MAGGAGQAVHDDPHELTLLLLTQAPAQRWNPARHTKPQVLLAQVALALAGVGHTLVHEPQWFGSLVVSTQLPLQRIAGAVHPV